MTSDTRYGPTMDWTQMILDFIAAVAWPLVVLAVVVILRKPLRRLMKRLRKFSGPGGTSAEFDAALATSEADASLDVVEPLTTDPRASAGDAPREPLGDRVTMTRDELQKIVTEFAEAGWAIRDLGTSRQAPSPLIGWDAHGKPFIEAWRGRDSVGDDPVWAMARANADLNMAMKQLHSAKHRDDPALLAAAQERYDRALRRLANAKALAAARAKYPNHQPDTHDQD